MDSNQFIQSSIRTESRIDQAKVNDVQSFTSVLQAFVASATLLDMYKKNIYYGKEVNQIKWTENLNVLIASTQHLAAGYQDSSSTDTLYIDPRVLHGVVGIATESAELVEAALKHLTQTKSLDTVNLQEEIGDVFWYVAILVDSLNGDWDNIQETVIAKLKKRYPEKFSSENAINRDVDGERKLLESGFE